MPRGRFRKPPIPKPPICRACRREVEPENFVYQTALCRPHHAELMVNAIDVMLQELVTADTQIRKAS